MKRNEYDCCKISETCSVECSIENKMFVVFRWNDSSNNNLFADNRPFRVVDNNCAPLCGTLVTLLSSVGRKENILLCAVLMSIIMFILVSMSGRSTIAARPLSTTDLSPSLALTPLFRFAPGRERSLFDL